MSDRNCRTLRRYPGLIYQMICLDSSSTLKSGYEILKGPGGICPCARGDVSNWLESMAGISTACCALSEIFQTTRLPRGHAGEYQDLNEDDHDLDYTLEDILSDSPVVLRQTDNPAPRRRSTSSASTTNVSPQSDAANGSPMQICRSSPHSRTPALIASTAGSPMRISPVSPVLVMAGEYGASGVPRSSSHVAQSEIAQGSITSSPINIPSPYPTNFSQLEWDEFTSRRFYVDSTTAWPSHYRSS